MKARLGTCEVVHRSTADSNMEISAGQADALHSLGRHGPRIVSPNVVLGACMPAETTHWQRGAQGAVSRVRFLAGLGAG